MQIGLITAFSSLCVITLCFHFSLPAAFLSTASLPSLPPSFSQLNTLSVSLGHSSHSPLSASHLPQDLFLSPMNPLSSVTYKHTHPILVDSSWEKRCDIFLNLFLLLLDVVISICINFPAKHDFRFPYVCVRSHCAPVPCLLYLSICWWTFWWVPFSGVCQQR